MHNTSHIPFKVLAFSRFLGSQCPTWGQAPVRIDLSDPDQALAELEPKCIISIPTRFYYSGNLEIKFRKFKDFHPDTLIKTSPVLSDLLDNTSNKQETSEGRISSDKRPNKDQISSARSTSLDNILDMVAMPGDNQETISGLQNVKTHVHPEIKEILLNIFKDREFKLLEKSWRGLKLLLKHVSAYDNAVIEIVPVSPDSLADTLEAMTAELINDLPSLIIFDLPMDNSPRSIEHLEIMSRFSETLLTPAVTWINPGFFNIDRWQDIKRLSYLPNYLEEPVYSKWQSFRKTSTAKWLTITCNRIMERYPYGNDNQPRLVPFKESDPLWVSPVWVIAGLIGLSLEKTGWPTLFTNWQKIMIQDLPLDTTDPANPMPTEVNFNRDRIDQFIRSGITPVIPMQGRDTAFIPAETTAGGSSLSYQLILSRVTQLILWCKDHLNRGLQGEELERGIRKAFNSYWGSTGHPKPDSLDISVDPPDADRRIPVRIILEPSRAILPSSKKVEMQFLW